MSKKRPRRPYRGPDPGSRGWGYKPRDKYSKRGCLPQMLILLAGTALIGFGVTQWKTQLGEHDERREAGADHYHMELRNSAQGVEAVSEAEADKASGEGQ